MTPSKVYAPSASTSRSSRPRPSRTSGSPTVPGSRKTCARRRGGSRCCPHSSPCSPGRRVRPRVTPTSCTRTGSRPRSPRGQRARRMCCRSGAPTWSWHAGHPRCQRIARGGERPTEGTRGSEAAEDPEEEGGEERRADEAGLDDQRHVVAVRAPVRLAGHELVVDGERVEPEPEERVGVQHVRDEVVDLEVRVLRAAARLHSRLEDRREEVPAREHDREQHRKRAADRHEQLGTAQVPPVRHGEDQGADAQSEQAAS